MNLSVKIEPLEGSKIKITDETKYPLLDNLSLNEFVYVNTIGILMISSVNMRTGEIEYRNPVIYKHNTIPSPTLEMVVDLIKDGRYTISYIVLPTLSAISSSDLCYFARWNGNNYDIICRYLDENQNVVEKCITDFRELVEINPINGNGISRIDEENIFSINNLKHCYINVCKKILEQRIFCDCSFMGNVDRMLICNRDLLWMAINVITYLIELEQFNEAERILNIILDCNGICKQPEIEEDCSCGCHQENCNCGCSNCGCD